MEMIVFSGIQGSGKTTFFHQRFSGSHVRLSLDLLRTRNREDILLYACLAAQQPLVIDNTNPTAGQRGRYATLGKAAGFRTILYFFEVELNDALARNALRPDDDRIPEIGVRGTFAKQERPSEGEMFDQMFVMKPAAEKMWIIQEIRREVR